MGSRCVRSLLVGLVALPALAGGSAQASATGERPPCITPVRLVADAQRLPGKVRLTSNQQGQVGAAWSSERCLVKKGFEVMFQFQITPSQGADGLAFVVQNDRGSAVGGGGGGIGYSGLPNSLAVEFDTFANFENLDPNSNHISVHSRGTLPNDESEVFSLGSTTQIPRFSDGAVHTCWALYTPGQLEIFLDTHQFPRLTVAVDIVQMLGLSDGRAWLGMTAATGDVAENHDVLTLTLL